MTTPTIRDRLRKLADDVLYLLACIRDGSSDSFALEQCRDDANTARDLLAAEPAGEGPSELELEEIELRLWERHRIKGWGGNEFMYDNNFSFALQEYRAILAHWGRPAAPPAPAAPAVKGALGLTDEVLLSIASDCKALHVADDVDDDNYSEVLAAMRAALARWGRPATSPAPLVGEVGEVGEWIHQQAVHGPDADEWRRTATLLNQLSAPAPAVVPVAVIVRWEFEVLDEHDQNVASGDASTLEEAAREGQHYLNQYQQDGPCTLELRRVEVLNPDAIPLPQGGEVPSD